MNTQQQVAASWTDQILQLIGAHGLVAIICTILFVRMIWAGWHMDKRGVLITNVFVGGFMGVACMYYFTPLTDFKSLSGGAFMTIIASIVVHFALIFITRYAYEKTSSEAVLAFHFFLSPKPIRVVRDGEVLIVPPHSDLTRMVDFSKKPEPDEHELDTGEDITDPKTQILTPEEVSNITGKFKVGE